MRILTVQFVPPGAPTPTPEFRHDLGLAVACLRAEGFDLSLLALDGYRPDLLAQAVARERPEHLLVDVPPSHVTAARHTIVDLGERHRLPVTIVGRYPTCLPEQAVSIPGVSALIVGEYESAAVALYRAIRDGQVVLGSGERGHFRGRTDLPGLWVTSEQGLVRNEPAPLADDPDRQGAPDREIFDYRRAVRQTRQAVFAATRGCDRWCSFCLNDWWMELYAGKGSFLRRRSVGALMEEISAVRSRYDGVRQAVFCDHCFLGDRGWLEEFAGEYPRRCGLPYRCHARLDAVDDRACGLLAESGCTDADIEIGSGSNFVREEVLGIKISESQIVAGVAALRRAGVRVHARVFVGAPYESEVSIEETLGLLARLELRSVLPRVFFPMPASRAAETCAENGWISGRGEENLFANRSVLDMPGLPARRIDDLAHHFDALLNRRRGRSLRAWMKKFGVFSTRPLHLFRIRKGRRRGSGTRGQ